MMIKPTIGQIFYAVSADKRIVELECFQIISQGKITEYSFEIKGTYQAVHINEEDLDVFKLMSTREEAETLLNGKSQIVCPSELGYENENTCPRDTDGYRFNCEECWNRSYKELGE